MLELVVDRVVVVVTLWVVVVVSVWVFWAITMTIITNMTATTTTETTLTPYLTNVLYERCIASARRVQASCCLPLWLSPQSTTNIHSIDCPSYRQLLWVKFDTIAWLTNQVGTQRCHGYHLYPPQDSSRIRLIDLLLRVSFFWDLTCGANCQRRGVVSSGGQQAMYVQRNILVRSRNNCCRGKAEVYIFWVCL